MPTESLLEKLATAIVIFDQQGRFRYINQSAEKELSVSKSQLLGEHYSFFIANDSLPIKSLVTRLASHDLNIQDSFKLKLNNQVSFTADFLIQKISLPSIHPVTSSSNSDNYQILIEWQNRELITKQNTELQLQQQNEANNLLLQKLAHEIKNPLSGIRGAAQLLALEIPSQQHEFTDIIQTEIDRLTLLVDRMLLPAKKSTRVLINIHQLIDPIIQLCQLDNKANIQLIKDYDPSLPELLLSPELIYQALLNLLQNALEACQEQSESEGVVIIKTRAVLQKTIAQKQYPLAIRVDIIDNGAGIPPAIESNIFLPLISGKNSTGLGLGIAQSLVQQHNGLVEYSREKAKTVFSIYLPVLSASDKEVTHAD